MANPWSIPATGWMIIVAGWWFSPIISWLVQKLFAYLVFDASKELEELEFHTVPALKLTLRDVEEKRMMEAARDDEGSRSRSDLERLDKMDMRLKSALYEAEDILDLVDYHRIEKEVVGDGSSCVQHLLQTAGVYIVAFCRGSWVLVQRLLHAAGTCVPCWTGSTIQRRCIDITPAPLLQFVQSFKQQLGRFFRGTIGQWRSGALLPVSRAASTVGVQRLYSWCRQLVANVTSCCGSILIWSTDRFAAARYYRDWSYEQVGIKSNQQKDGNVSFFERIRLRKQIKGIEDILTSSKKSRLLNQNSSSSSSTPKDADNESSSSCTVKNSDVASSGTQKEIDDLYRNIEQKVFGREEDREHISRMLRKGPDTYAASSSTSKPYSVIGIYGITGSGKTTLAQYVCDYENGVGHFNPIMFIHVGKTFSLGDILRDTLGKITESRPSNDKDLKSLKTRLWESLEDKRFLLVLDDLWVNDDNQKGWDILLDTLSAALSGSRILVTAQKKDAAEALGAQEQISIPDLEEEVYLSLFMHHARPAAANDYGEYERIGRNIANRLHRSPIAAATVGKQLQRNKSISFWETTANLDVLDKTMGALWWSYQQLGVDIRRCFAYCSTFPRGYRLERDELVRIWIAQGFVNTRSNTTDELELEYMGWRYFDELLSFSFLQAGSNFFRKTMTFTIHDLLHELAERVSGSEFFRIGLNGSPEDIPRGVRHLFIERKNVAWINEKNLDLGNLHTLIINEDPYAETEDPVAVFLKEIDYFINRMKEETIKRNHDLEKVLRQLFMRLKKLRVLIIKLKFRTEEFSVPATIDQVKHLRYIGFRFRPYEFHLILPRTFRKLYHIQTIDIPCRRASCPEDMANLIHLRHISAPLSFPNIGMLKSLRTMRIFIVKEEQGYGFEQLKHLNKLGGTLIIYDLGIVGSKEEALEAHLTHKERLRRLELNLGFLRRFGPDVEADEAEVEAEVLEGLCPPKDLQELRIENYRGSTYPNWILSRHHPDTPKQLHILELWSCSSQLASIPEDREFFISLRELKIFGCDWDRLPENMERLVSLQTLEIRSCHKMELLPKLPVQSLKNIFISVCKVLSTTCKEEGHENWCKIQQIPKKEIY